MPKSFLLFPTGLVGSALLLLRMSLAIALASGAVLANREWMLPGVALLAIALILGLFTRIAAGFGMIAAAAIAILLGGTLGMSAALHGAALLALAMLGAGGYSIDALRFGRRVITLDR